MASRSFRKLLFFATASVAIAAATFFDPKGLRRYGRLRGDVERLAKRNQELALENARLAREVDALQHDRRYQERAVREELGFVRPGQLLLELDDDEAAEPRQPTLAGVLP
jgi:cell division protein FtsB